MIWKLPGNLKSTNKLVPVILSGGSGTRLWPLSRECFPKQYLNLSEDNKYSLLQNTYLNNWSMDYCTRTKMDVMAMEYHTVI